jgi:hypothetical protein
VIVPLLEGDAEGAKVLFANVLVVVSVASNRVPAINCSGLVVVMFVAVCATKLPNSDAATGAQHDSRVGACQVSSGREYLSEGSGSGFARGFHSASAGRLSCN